MPNKKFSAIQFDLDRLEVLINIGHGEWECHVLDPVDVEKVYMVMRQLSLTGGAIKSNSAYPDINNKSEMKKCPCCDNGYYE